jgi:predicted CoA-substrate-specific enzyme activase
MVKDFIMNDKCAAGTGKFIEVIADLLEVDLKDLGELSQRSRNPLKINSTCVVFAQSEVVSLIARKKKKEDIVAGINNSIASRIHNMAKRVGVKDVVFFDGGPAKNIGIKLTLEDELGTKVFVPKRPQIVNALGAALTAQDLAPGKKK